MKKDMTIMNTNRKTAAEYRADAAAIGARRLESIDRCDTDGFVSQWASGLSMLLAEKHARLAEAGFVAEFDGLYQGDRRVAAKRIGGNFGLQWLLAPSETALIAKRGKPYLPVGGYSRVLRALGLSERLEMAPAWAGYGGRGHGLSGSAWVETYRDGDEWGADATLSICLWSNPVGPQIAKPAIENRY